MNILYNTQITVPQHIISGGNKNLRKYLEGVIPLGHIVEKTESQKSVTTLGMDFYFVYRRAYDKTGQYLLF